MLIPSMNTVLHYTGVPWEGNGIRAVVRQLAQTPAYRNNLTTMAGFVTEKSPG